jgi:hypothetical protein
MIVYAIDPGPTRSALVIFEDLRIHEAVELDNATLLDRLRNPSSTNRKGQYVLAIEKIACYGMPVGASVLETVYWSGRFAEAWETSTGGANVLRLDFSDVRLALCRARNAKESYVRRAVLDRLGEPGTKKHPGVTYGVHGHAWSALALGVVAFDQVQERTA